MPVSALHRREPALPLGRRAAVVEAAIVLGLRHELMHPHGGALDRAAPPLGQHRKVLDGELGAQPARLGRLAVLHAFKAAAEQRDEGVERDDHDAHHHDDEDELREPQGGAELEVAT